MTLIRIITTDGVYEVRRSVSSFISQFLILLDRCAG
jgi:hypothetical protein